MTQYSILFRAVLAGFLLANGPFTAAASTQTSFPVTILVVDTPVDPNHPIISPLWDRETMEHLQTTDTNGQPVSWLELNNQMKAEFERRLDSRRYDEQIKFLEAESRSDPSIQHKVAKWINSYLRPNWRNDLEAVARYLHGTHVAGLAVRGGNSTQIKLVTYPIDDEIAPYSISTSLDKLLLAPDTLVPKIQSGFRRQWELLEKAVEDSGAKVVNMSFNRSSSDEILGLLKNALPFWVHPMIGGQLKYIAAQISQKNHAKIINLFQRHPDTVFVVSAGNESLDLTHLVGQNEAAVRAPNVLVVGALKPDGELADFSNRSSRFVNICALGVAVPSACVGGEIARFSGTSMAAPIVANKMAAIRQAHPHLSAPEAIHELLTQHASSSENLSRWVKEGKFLPIDPDLLHAPSAQKGIPQQCSALLKLFGR